MKSLKWRCMQARGGVHRKNKSLQNISHNSTGLYPVLCIHRSFRAMWYLKNQSPERAMYASEWRNPSQKQTSHTKQSHT